MSQSTYSPMHNVQVSREKVMAVETVEGVTGKQVLSALANIVKELKKDAPRKHAEIEAFKKQLHKRGR